MTLGIILSIGDSFSNMEKSGQTDRFKKFYLPVLAKSFEKIYIFSYADEQVEGLPNNVEVIPNKYKLHRYFYAILLPLLQFKLIKNIDVLRVYHLGGTIPAIISKLLMKKPFIFNYAYDYPVFANIEQKSLQRLLFILLKPLAVKFSDKIFVANRDLLGVLPKIKSIYLPNGVDTNFFKPLQKLQKTDHKIQILSVGRLENQKNFSSLIKAVSGLDIDLVIIGNGSLKDELVDLAKQRKVSLTIIDKVDNTHMPGYYNRADIFVLPSLIEGHPKVLLEAMACGLACIATNVQGIRDTVLDNETALVSSINSSSIRSKILALIDNKELRNKLAKNAREAIKQSFSLDSLLAKEVKSIQELG